MALRFWLGQSETHGEEELAAPGAAKPQFPPSARGWSTAVPPALLGECAEHSEEPPQTSEQAPGEKLYLVVSKCLQKAHCCGCPLRGPQGPERGVLRFVFVLGPEM